MKLNLNLQPTQLTAVTHEGAPARRLGAEQELRRAILACMLWEDQFYENGVAIADRVRKLVPEVDPTALMNLAIEARVAMKLRHVPLLLAREMARYPEHKKLVAHTLEQIIQRADEIAEFLAIYWHGEDNGAPLAKQVKLGLALALNKFNEFQLARYRGEKSAVSLKDVLFLVHAKPADAKGIGRKVNAIERPNYKRGEVRRHPNSVFTKLVEGTLATPDTWETQLSAGADKRATFERLIAENKLGALALLRNLRNMQESDVPKELVADALARMNTERVLPFRFIAAARAVPAWEDIIEPTMLKCIEGHPKLEGRTILLVDVSGSMDAQLSGKSDMTRVDAAEALAVLLRETCEEVLIASFSGDCRVIPPRRGFALRDAIHNSQPHGSTYLSGALVKLKGEPRDRIIVITDEQSHDAISAPGCERGYIINVASYQHGVGYDKWFHVNGWSEAVIDYIMEWERTN